MNLIVIRHGRAGLPRDLGMNKISDDLRPLTVEGRRRMRRNIEGLLQVVPTIDVLGTSPLVRAVETAQVLTRFYRTPATEVPALGPGGKRDQLVSWIAQQKAGATVAIVGHEPALSRLISWLLVGSDHLNLGLKKGGACCLLLEEQVKAGKATLGWLLTPQQMRAMR